MKGERWQKLTPEQKRADYQRVNKYYKQLKQKLIFQFGGKCQNPQCSNILNLEFHHKIPCQEGRGRGRNNRIREVQKHPEMFELLCSDCHKYHRYSREVLQVMAESNQTLKTN